MQRKVKKLTTMLLGAQLFLAPSAAHAQAMEANPAVQPTVAPVVAPAVQPTVAPQVAPMVQPTVAPWINPAITIAPEAHLPFSNSSFEVGLAGKPTIQPVIGLPLPGQLKA